MTKKQFLERSDVVDIFSNFKTDTGGVMFYGHHGYFISDTVSGIVEVRGDFLRRFLFSDFAYKTDFVDYDKRYIELLEQKAYARYQTYFYIDKYDIGSVLEDMPIRRLKRCLVKLEYDGREAIVYVIEGDEIIDQKIFSIHPYRNARNTEVFPFSFILNASEFSKIIFNGFANCDRIGMKFSSDSDIIFFNKSLSHSKRIWIQKRLA